MAITAIIIDDHKDVQNTFSDLLYFSGVKVVGIGSNGKEAVELYKEFHPDIVFMDVAMPEYDGFYGLEEIRKYDPKSVVVMVTGSFNVDEKLDSCNANAILPKPFEMNKIMNVINSFCVKEQMMPKL